MTAAELRAARKVLGLTQSQCAQIVGLTADSSANMIGKYERGEYPVPPYVETILDLALRYEVVRKRLGIIQPATPAIEDSNNQKIAKLQARIGELLKDNQRIADAIALIKEVDG